VKLIGIVLIVLGVIGLAYGGISWTTREKVVDAGPLQISRDKTQSVPLPPLAGGLCLAAGVVLLVAASRKR
jgi:uncharacterized membrane protein YidH (DUF202 family)